MTEIYEVREKSRNNPDNGPDSPPARGMWVWRRTGPHPQGVWQAMDATGDFSVEYQRNHEEFPVPQDAAHGSPGDFGNYTCHACEYFGDGYPEPGHHNICDGVCKRSGCPDHTALSKIVARAERVRDAHYIDFQPQGLGNDEGTEQMGGQAHAEASVDETGAATATASAPEADTSADESSAEDTQGETASSDSE